MSGFDGDCPKCRGRMEDGFVIDRGDTTYTRVAQWVEGEPEGTFWLGVNLKGRRILNVRTHRCTRCGFLESYAN